MPVPSPSDPGVSAGERPVAAVSPASPDGGEDLTAASSHRGSPALEAPEPEPRARLGVGGWLAIGWLGLVVFVAVFAPVLPFADPNRSMASLAREGPLTDGHLLGGDASGRDLLSRIAWGSRASLSVGLGAVALAMIAGGVFGVAAGYFRGRVETVFMTLMDAMLGFPQLILALALVTFLRGDPNQGGGLRLPSVLVIIVAMGVVATPILARIARVSTMSWTQRDFVLAARALGVRDRRIIWREVLPNVLPAMLSLALLGVGIVIVAEGGLSLLGVGVQMPTPSWGNIIALGRTDLRDAPHIVFAPAVVIFLTVLALNYLGDVLRARFDVREAKL